MGATSLGRIDWSVKRDEDGHRNYEAEFLVETDSVEEGPTHALIASGLPTVGSTWNQGSDYDTWAYCTPRREVKVVVDKEKNYYYKVKCYWATRPIRRPQGDEVGDPLLEPDRVSGSFLKYTEETETDRHGNMIKSSSHEPIHGVKKDVTRATVTIAQNVASLNLETFTEMMNTVNDRTLWGLASRKIKLDSIRWTREIYGLVDFYYTRQFDFAIDFNGFDYDDIVDKGFKVFDTESHEDTPENRLNPENYVMKKDGKGENITEPINLKGNGDALTDFSDGPYFIDAGDPPYTTGKSTKPIEIYDESNFLLLGIPSTLVV